MTLCRRDGGDGEVTDTIENAADMPPRLHGNVAVVPWKSGSCRLVCPDGDKLAFAELPYPINGAGVGPDGQIVVWDDVERVALAVRLA